MARLTDWRSSAEFMEQSVGIGLAERIESVKAGLLGAVSTGLAFGAALIANSWLLAPHVQRLAGLEMSGVFLTLLISGSIAALSGFLFGVTYRYIIRQDRNPHLKSGSVLAFGLVRGLAQVDVVLHNQSDWLPLAILVLESILLFAAARLVLDQAIGQGWVKAFR